MKVYLVEKPTVEKRGNAAVVIFPSRPYWFSATKEIEEILKILEKEIAEECAIRKIIKNLDVSETEAKETLNEVCNLLYENGVLVVDGKISDKTKELEPYFQVNSVENVLVISATQGCNLECLHCYSNAKKQLQNEMKFESIKELINDLASMPWKNDVSVVGLTGGEYFMRPDALEIIDYIHVNGFKVLVSSNSLLLTDSIISKLSTYKNFKISISLDGPTVDIHEKIRGEGTFNKTVENIKKLTGNGIFVGVNMFVYQGNIHLIKETIQLADELGVESFNCLNLMRVGRANSPRSKKNLIRIPEYALYNELFSILRENSRYKNLMKNSTFANQIMGVAAGIKSHYCGIGTNRALYVRSNGDIYPCPDTAISRFHIGNVRSEKLMDIWEKSALLKELRELDVDTLNKTCSKCDVRYFCGGGCRGENFQVTNELYSPHFNCEENRKTIIEMMWMLTEEPDFFQEKTGELYKKVCL